MKINSKFSTVGMPLIVALLLISVSLDMTAVAREPASPKSSTSVLGAASANSGKISTDELAKLKAWLEEHGDTRSLNGNLCKYMGLGDGPAVVMKGTIIVEGENSKRLFVTNRHGRTFYLILWDIGTGTDSVQYLYRLGASADLEKAILKRGRAAPENLQLAAAEKDAMQVFELFVDKLVRQPPKQTKQIQ